MILSIFGSLYKNSWEGTRFILIYMLPILLIVHYWIYLRISKSNYLISYHFVLDALVFTLGLLRFLGLFPFSGHMLFLVYSVFTTQNRIYQLLAVILIIETTYFKLILWQDFNSWILGIIVSVPFVILYRFKYPQKNIDVRQ